MFEPTSFVTHTCGYILSIKLKWLSDYNTQLKQGDNAAFALEVVDSTFLTFGVTPTSGRDTAAVSLTVRNPQLLDYEIPEYRMQIVKVC